MAIVKCANRSGSTVKGLVSYVMDDAKMKCMDVYGLDCADTTKESIIRQMIETKQMFGKVGGREVYHLIVSFHKDEVITPEKANQLAMQLYLSIPEFREREAVLVTQRHSDYGNIHTHIVVNSVSFETGRKLHTSRNWLQNIKDTNDNIIIDNGLTVVEKGHDFYGNEIERNEPWNMEKYLMKNDLAPLSWKNQIATCIQETISNSISKEQFIDRLAEKEITVCWLNNRKHITFLDNDGHKIRDSRLEKDYGLKVDKESLLEIFEINLNKEISQEDDSVELSEIQEDISAFENDYDELLRSDDIYTSSDY